MEDIIRSISNAPTIIADLKKTGLNLKKQANIVQENLDGIKNLTVCEVANEKNGSKKAYPNAEAREIELEKRLKENDIYENLRVQLVEIEEKRAENYISIEQIENEFSVNRYKVRCYTAEKIEQASSKFCEGLQVVEGLGSLLMMFTKHTPAKTDSTDTGEDCPF